MCGRECGVWVVCVVGSEFGPHASASQANLLQNIAQSMRPIEIGIERTELRRLRLLSIELNIFCHKTRLPCDADTPGRTGVGFALWCPFRVWASSCSADFTQTTAAINILPPPSQKFSQPAQRNSPLRSIFCYIIRYTRFGDFHG